MILRFILFALGIYIIYKVIFELVIPIFRVTQKVRRQFGDMQDQMNATQNGSGNPNRPSSPPPPSATSKSTKAGDYIDFEEVK